MALLNQSVQVYGQIPTVFETLRAGQAPNKFNRELLRDIGFKSSNYHAVIPLLKGLGFLTPDGTPTERYKQFLDSTKWKKVLAEAIREAYSDVFVIKSKPTRTDRKLIAGKYKSTFNLSESAADRAAATFLALLDLADPDALYGKDTPSEKKPTEAPVVATLEEPHMANALKQPKPAAVSTVGLHYNIQIHLPATKDVEVYNAIFKSLRDHLLG